MWKQQQSCPTLPRELWLIILANQQVRDLHACQLVSHTWNEWCQDNQLWQMIFERDYGSPHPDESSGDDEVPCWKDRYRDASMVPTWHPGFTDDGGEYAFVFSEENRKIFRDSKGFFPKVISAVPVRTRHLRMALLGFGELVLVHNQSTEAVRNWLAGLDRGHFASIQRNDGGRVQFCYASLYEKRLGGFVNGQVICGDPLEFRNTYRTRVEVELRFDRNFNKVEWRFDDEENGVHLKATCPAPPRPLYVVFSTGATEVGAVFLDPHIKKSEEAIGSEMV